MKRIKSLKDNLNILFFLNGILIPSMIYFCHGAMMEKEQNLEVMRSIKNASHKTLSQDSLVIGMMHAYYTLLNSPVSFFFNHRPGYGKVDSLAPHARPPARLVSDSWESARILARGLKYAGFIVRIARLTGRDSSIQHALVEVKTGNGWVALDEQLNLFFTRPDGKPASIADMQKNWSYYQNQLPRGYRAFYHYHGVQYTNWNKIPVVMPFMRDLFKGLLGPKRTDTICISAYFLQPYKLAYNVSIVLFILVCWQTLIVAEKNWQHANRERKQGKLFYLYFRNESV